MMNEGRSDEVGRIGFQAARRLLASLKDDDTDEGLAREPLDVEHIGGFVVTRRLGEGSSSVVYLGHRLGSQRAVAIKLFKHPLANDQRAKRAWRELDLLEQIDSPVLPKFHESGQHNGRLYLVSDYVDGMPLGQYCESRCPDVRSKVQLLIAAAEAMQQMHEVGLIHRDVKPANILIDDRGRVYFIDLGVALVREASEDSQLTNEGVPIGTPAFMSPEQARGERSALSIRSDIYALGATAYKLLTGQAPHDLDLPLLEGLRRIAEVEPRDPRQLNPHLPRPLALILLRAVALSPQHRFATAIEFAQDLQRWLDGRPIESTRTSIAERAWLAARRRPFLSLASSAAAIAIVASVFLGSQAIASAKLADERAELLAQREEWERLVLQKETESQQRLLAVQKNVLLALKNRDLVEIALGGQLLDAFRGLEGVHDETTIPVFLEAIDTAFDVARQRADAAAAQP